MKPVRVILDDAQWMAMYSSFSSIPGTNSSFPLPNIAYSSGVAGDAPYVFIPLSVYLESVR